MTAPASSVFDREYPAIRSRLIELSAALDRVDRAEGLPTDDPRITQIESALRILADRQPRRAERVQMEFSIRD